MTTIKYVEYDDETKQLAQVLYDLLRSKNIGELLEADVLWSDLNKETLQDMYAIIDDILEEAADLDYTYDEEDDSEDWEL